MNLRMFVVFLGGSFCGWTAHAAETVQEIPVWKKPFQAHSIAGSDWSLKPGIESRHRFEYRDNFNLRDQTYEDDAINLLRNRINLDLIYQPEKDGGKMRFFSEAQDSRSFASSAMNRNAGFVNEFDLRQLFAEWSGDPRKIPVQIKIGRQELSYGDERLVGAFNWSNVARVFNAAKLVYSPTSWLQLDSFISRVVRVERERPDHDSSNDNFFGLVSAVKPAKEHVLDAYFFARNLRDNSLASERTGIRGPLKECTLGNRFRGKKWNFDYGAEYAIQFGSRAHDDIRAWAFHQDVGYEFAKVKFTPKIYTEFNHASGDRDTRDGEFQTFDQLYPGNHSKYGYMDLTGFKNMNHVMLGSSIKPAKKLTAAADFHWYFRDARETAWFADNGAVVRAANPRAGRQLGEELDLTVSYKWIPELETLIGYSHFFSGPFIQDTGSNDDANFFYVQTTFKV